MISNSIIDLLCLRDCAHVAHWKTTSYSEHKALGSFYEGLTDLLDTFVETYQGKNGGLVIVGISAIKAQRSTEITDIAYRTAMQMELLVKKEDTDLLNILAEIKQLCNHTNYLLTLK